VNLASEYREYVLSEVESMYRSRVAIGTYLLRIVTGLRGILNEVMFGLFSSPETVSPRRRERSLPPLGCNLSFHIRSSASSLDGVVG
jgi:hypothetical protein